MLDGLYTIAFRSATDEGAGVVAITNGAVNGGDYAYVYQGRLQENGQGVSANLEVTKFNPVAESIFGPVDSFELEVSGPATDRSFELSGHVKGNHTMQISITGHYFKPLI